MYQEATSVMARHAPVRVLVFCIGGNDIQSWTDPERLARQIVAVAEYIHIGHGVEQVVISSIIPRERASCSEFNELVFRVNGELKKKVKKYEGNHIVTWLHHGFADEEVRQSLILPDGVHLNRAGYNKFYISLKSCLVKTVKRLLSDAEIENN